MMPSVTHLIEQELIRRAQLTLSKMPIYDLYKLMLDNAGVSVQVLADEDIFKARQVKVHSLNIPTRVANLLEAQSLFNAGHVVDAGREILWLPGIGKKSRTALAEAILSLGLRFA